MGAMDRLGLWGAGTSFSDQKTFQQQLGAGGPGAMELVAMDMKARGLFLARTLSYAGAEFETSYLETTGSYKTMYNDVARIWQKARELLVALIKDGNAEAGVMKQYWGSHLSFFRQLALGAKVDGLVAKVKEALNSGYCVVIGMQTTGE